VNVTVPDKENSEFQGFIRVVNKDNPDDFDYIPVYLKTTVNVSVVQMKIYQSVLKQKALLQQKIFDLFR
jgi:hypothetical protein